MKMSMAALLGMVICTVLFFIYRPQVVIVDPIETAARAWLKESVADPKAEIVKFEVIANVEGKRYQRILVRGLNGFGGPVLTRYIYEIEEGPRIGKVYRDADFVKMLFDKYGAAQAKHMSTQFPWE